MRASGYVPFAAALALASCVMAPPVSGGSDLEVDTARRVSVTARTRTDLLRALGMPAAIFSRGGTEPVPGAPNWATEVPAAHFGRPQSAAPAFEYFVDCARPDDVVYYWFHSRTTKKAVVGPFAIGEWSDLSLVRLWALVDPRTGAVRRITWRKDD